MRLLIYKHTHTTTRDGQLITVGPILLLDFKRHYLRADIQQENR